MIQAVLMTAKSGSPKWPSCTPMGMLLGMGLKNPTPAARSYYERTRAMGFWIAMLGAVALCFVQYLGARAIRRDNVARLQRWEAFKEECRKLGERTQ